MSATTTHVYPMDFDGPLPTGAVRGQVVAGTRTESSAPSIGVSPMIVNGMTFNDDPPPVLGGSITASLTFQAPYYYQVENTNWTVTVSYGGFTTVPDPIVGSADGTTFTATVPGTYTFTAVTTYIAGMNEPPYGPTTVSGSVNIAPPDTAAKGGAINTPTAVGMSATMVDPLYVGGAEGQKVGPMMVGWVQENVSITWCDGTIGGSNGWIPQSPSYSFYLQQGAITDKQWLTTAPGYQQALWNSLANGSTVSTQTQQLRYQWTMTDSNGQDHNFTVQLNTLNWT